MASAAAETEPPRISMAFDLCIAPLNHGSMLNATPVVGSMSTIATMVDTVWHRLESVMGVKPLTVVALRDALGVSYQAAVKVKKGGGLSLENTNKAAKKFGVNPEWLATGKGEKIAYAKSKVPPPAAPAPDFRDNHHLTPEQWEMFQAFSIAATSEEKKTIIERYESLKQIAAQVYGSNHGEKK